MLLEAEDPEVARLAAALHRRNLLRCIDVIQRVELALPRRKGEAPIRHRGRVMLGVAKVETRLKALMATDGQGPSRVLLDRYSRFPYKRYQDSNTPLNSILIRGGSGQLLDIADFSSVIAAAQPFEISRAYVFRDDSDAERMVENIIGTEVRRRNR